MNISERFIGRIISQRNEIYLNADPTEIIDTSEVVDLTTQLCNIFEFSDIDPLTCEYNLKDGMCKIRVSKTENPEIWDWYCKMIEKKYIIDEHWSSNDRTSNFNRYGGNNIGKNIHAIVEIDRNGTVFSHLTVTLRFYEF